MIKLLAVSSDKWVARASSKGLSKFYLFDDDGVVMWHDDDNSPMLDGIRLCVNRSWVHLRMRKSKSRR